MSASPALLLGPAPTRAPDDFERNPPVLIRVPALADAAPQTTAWRRDRVRPARLIPRPHASKPARRRLRREFRLAGSAALCFAPLAWTLLALWGPRPSVDAATAPPVLRIAATAYAIRGYDEVEPEPLPEPLRPLATISFAPVLEPGPEPDAPELAEMPDVRPAGFLLPDDGSMESVYAGR